VPRGDLELNTPAETTAAGHHFDAIQIYGRADAGESLQRDVDERRSASAGLEGGPLEDDLAQAVQAERSNGKPLEPELRDEVEAATGADLRAASQAIGTLR
jgi:hypothetical protein